MFLLQYALVSLVGYLLGCIPTGYIMGRLRGVNVLEYGSGRTGGTNVLRSAGRWAAVFTGAGDLAKGALAVLIGRTLLGTELAGAMAGIAAVVGHNWSIYIGFRGGAGTAPYVGGFIVLSPIPTIIVGLTGAIAGFGLRYASVASILISSLMPPILLVAVLFFDQPVEHLGYALVGGGLILFSHRPNIRRLLEGTERRIGEPGTKIGAGET